MSDVLAGKTALVTGAARGIGLAIASALAESGANVLLTDIDEEQAYRSARQLQDAGLKVAEFAFDVRKEEGWERAIGKAVEDCGGLDILVNNAGIQVSELITELDMERTQRLIGINLLGTAMGLKYGFRAMRAGGSAGKGGNIINLASVAALSNTPGVMMYSATKSAVLRMTQVAAVEAGALDYGIKVNCLCPGLIRTDLGNALIDDFSGLGLAGSEVDIGQHVAERTPLGKMGSVEDVAKAAVFLCSPAADFVNGVALPVDGGFILT